MEGLRPLVTRDRLPPQSGRIEPEYRKPGRVIVPTVAFLPFLLPAPITPRSASRCPGDSGNPLQVHHVPIGIYCPSEVPQEGLSEQSPELGWESRELGD